MPDRFLREGFLRSSSINDLDDSAQGFYVRLLLLMDDFGCYDGRPSVIASQAYQAREVLPDVTPWLKALHEHGLIVRYSNKGKPYLAITQWMCGIRGDRQFPAPPLNVDLPTRSKLRGHYGRPIGWRNPHGSDPVSILLDTELRAIVPQPDEWRDSNDWSPITGPHSDYAPVTGNQSLVRAPKLSVVTDDQQIQEQKVLQKVLQQQEQPPPPKVLQQSLQTSDCTPKAAATPSNGGIGLDQGGAWTGLSDEQRLHWQGMFNDMSIPDQLERAAAWLQVNAAERDAIAARGEGFGAFIVRWLLREARGSTVHAKGAPDA